MQRLMKDIFYKKKFTIILANDDDWSRYNDLNDVLLLRKKIMFIDKDIKHY
jgi:hypothetical protein